MLKIRKLGVLKMALFSGLFSFFVGLISIILMWIFATLLGDLLIAYSQGSMLPSFGFTSLIILPFGYGVFGFISGLIFTPIMNLVFKIIRGLDIVIEEPETQTS